MNFASIKNLLNEQKEKIKDGVSRYKNKEFMDAVVAGCALVSAADGTIDTTEKQKMAGYIQRSEELKVFNMSDVIKRFTEIVESFEFDFVIGKGEALKIINKIKKNVEASKLLIRVCISIGSADGNFDEKETAIVKEICNELNLNPSEFGL